MPWPEAGGWPDSAGPGVSGVHPSNGKSSLRKAALCHPGGWVQAQAYPRAPLRSLKVHKKGTWKERFTFLCIS